MKPQIKPRRTIVLSSLIAAILTSGAAHGQTVHTWGFTADGTFNWNDTNSWIPSVGYPNSAGAEANVNIDILGAQTIRLNENITVGVLGLGDADGSHTMTVSSGVAGSSLTFDSGQPAVAAELVLSVGALSGVPANSLMAVPILLNSDLFVKLGSTARALQITSSGSLDTGLDRTVTVLEGVAATNQFTLSGDVLGSGTFVNESNAAVIVNGAKTFTGTFVLNKGVGGSNTGSLTLTSGSVANAEEIIINGYLTNGATQNGGSVHSGNASGMGTNPGQRLTQNRITLNGGTLSPAGQTLNGAALNTLVQDNVETLNFNSGYSLVSMSRGGGSSGTLLNVETLERSPGASAYVRSSTLGVEVEGSRLLFGNAGDYLIGAGASSGTTMSIIPWVGANNTSAGTANPTGFATYTSTGVRALFVAGEYAVTMGAGEDANVNIGVFSALSAPTTVNSLRLTNTGTANIGTDQVLTVASGGVFFSSANYNLGGTGAANAGTLNFDDAEGVIWSIATNTNIIGASITGSGGLSKAGTGTLILTGVNNEYSGLTYVGGGILQVGDGSSLSTLGFSEEIGIAAGAQLTLTGGEMIQDTATLRLEQYGLFNGKVTLFSGVNETIGALFLGEALMDPGTYGPMGSGADFESDVWFGGLGVLTVVPEPGSAVLLLGGIAMLVSRRRRV